MNNIGRELQALLNAYTEVEQVYQSLFKDPQPIRMIVFNAQKQIETLISEELRREE